MKYIYFLTGGLFVFYAILLLFISSIDFGVFCFLFLGLVFLLYPFIKNRKKIKLFFRVFVVLLFLFVGGLETLIQINSEDDQAPESVSYLIVLGGGIKGDEPSLTLANRLDTAYDYLKDNLSKKVVVTGGIGVGKTLSEGEVMKKYLMKKGISEERIIVEDKATSTYENFLFSKELINSSKKIIVVSSDFHLFRAKKIAEKMDLEPYGLSSETPLTVAPQAHLREYLAIVKTLILDN
ncbi:YdcF family protein [Metabacillus fastidiosus]|uniref:YdcF family protein n=1 Tax=Metabacillus fastidiosus TaxID=1458 RepID=A0ABU6NZK9_9BACI|nr:YdcF family protein [Metabacillus fastidiosus]MED4402466.1 YdcF family protein [Metabacillus fastidiosus]MED4461753.1 YdcF family protein [Metabacillus fastidiosus]